MPDFDPTSATLADSPPAFDPSSATMADDAPAPDPKEDVGRVTGLGGRALIKGIGTLADTPGVLGNLAERAGKSGHNYIRHVLGLPEDDQTPIAEPDHKGADLADLAANKVGYPKPETAGERIGSAAVSALPSAVMAPEAPVAGVVGNMLGGAGAQSAKEAGAGPLGQAAAGIAAGSVPALPALASAAAKGIVRGGEKGASAMEGRLADAAKSGTNLSAGEAGGSPFVQYLESTMRKLWGGGPLKTNTEAQNASMGAHVKGITDNLSGGNDISPTGAGTAIVKGIGDKNTPGTAFGGMNAAESAAYNHLDSLVHPDTPITMDHTLANLDTIAKPTPGAEATTTALKPKDILGMRSNLRKDMKGEDPRDAAPDPVLAAGGNQAQIPGKPDTTSIPYSAARALRSDVGNNIEWGFGATDPAKNRGLKQIYGSLSKDLTNGAAQVSPEALAAANNADALYARNAATRESLEPMIDKAGGPEYVYQAAMSGSKLGGTKINNLMTNLPPEHQNIVRAAVLSRMGKPVASATTQGTDFSANTFLTNWKNMDGGAKDALFGQSGKAGDLRDGLDSLARTSENIRNGDRLKNFSGTGTVVGHMAGGAAAWEALKSVILGNHMAAAGVGAGFALNNLASRALTNPKTVNWMASATKAGPSQLPNMINQLNNSQDPTDQDLAEYLKNPRPARASGGRIVGHDELVNRLIQKWKDAKKATDASTKPLLRVPDSAITKALSIAQESI